MGDEGMSEREIAKQKCLIVEELVILFNAMGIQFKNQEMMLAKRLLTDEEYEIVDVEIDHWLKKVIGIEFDPDKIGRCR